MAAKVQITVEAKDAASQVVNKITGEFKSLEKIAPVAPQKANLSFTELSSVINIARQVLDAFKKGYDFAREGAEIEFTRTKFERLAQAIGTTSDALMGDLRSATRGTLSDMELMASVTDLVGLGLAKDHDEAVRLASVSAGLGMNMNQLVLTLTNMTTMRFDALGVRVDGFKEKVAALEEAGYSADAAFREAFLQQAEEQLKTVGNAADTAAGEFLKFEANIKNTSDAFKEQAAEAILPLIKAYNEASAAQEQFDKATEKGIEVMGNAVPTAERARAAYLYYHPEVREAGTAALEAEASQAALNRELEAGEQAALGMGEALEQVDYRSVIDLTMQLTDADNKFMETAKEIRGEIMEVNAEFQAGNLTLEERDAKLSELSGKLQENATQHEEWAKRTVFALVQTRLAAEGGIDAAEFNFLIGLGESMGIIDQQTADLAESINSSLDTLDSSVAQGAISDFDTLWTNLITKDPAAQTKAQADGMTAAFDAVNTGNAQGQVDDFAQRWQNLLDMPHSTTFTVNYQQNGAPPNTPGPEPESLAPYTSSGRARNAPQSVVTSNNQNIFLYGPTTLMISDSGGAGLLEQR